MMNKIKSLGMNVYMGFLQMITILTATVLIGTLVGIDIPVILFTTGLGSIVFTILTKGKIPIGLGLSGSWCGTMIAMSAFGLDHIVGVTVISGVLYVLFGLLIKWKPQILKLFTPYVLNLAVFMIAINLVTTAVGLVSTAPLTGIATVVSIGLLMKKKGFERFVFPLGVLIGTIVHGFTVGLSSELTAMYIPTFVMPVINNVTLGSSLIFIALVTEALGDSKLVADATGKGYDPSSVIVGNGVASIISGLLGGMSVTTYTESCSLTRSTKHTDYKSIIFAGLFFIIMAFIPQVTMAINFIPIEALSGLLLYLFASVGLSKMNDTHAETRNEEIIGVLGLSAFFLAPHVFPNISQIAVGMLTMTVTYVALMLIDKYKNHKQK